MIVLTRWAVGLCRLLSLISAAAVVLMMLHVCLDVVLLNLFRISMNSTPEIVARYYMVALAFLPLCWLTLRDQMISVELLEFAMPPRVRRLSDFLVAVSGVALYALLAYATWGKALREARTGTFVELVRYQMPVWHSYFIVPVGFALAALACALIALAALSGKLRQAIDDTTKEENA